MAKAVEEAGEVSEDATAALLITGLKRPFTPNALVQVLSETGIVKGKGFLEEKGRGVWTLAKAGYRKSVSGLAWSEGHGKAVAPRICCLFSASFGLVGHTLSATAMLIPKPCCVLLRCCLPGMWLTKLKDTAYVVMQEASHAQATRKKLQVCLGFRGAEAIMLTACQTAK